MSVTESIREAMAGLTSKQKSIAQYIMDNPDEASYLSLKELSTRTGSSEVSVLRLCRALGYDNFVALKDALKQHTQGAFRAATLSAPSLHPDNRIGTAEELLNKVCADEQNNLNATIAQLDAQMLVNCAHRLLKSERVFVFAHDRSYVRIIFATGSTFCAYRPRRCSLAKATPCPQYLPPCRKGTRLYCFHSRRIMSPAQTPQATAATRAFRS